jgi:N-acetylmuramoyl-L-alanine amidase
VRWLLAVVVVLGLLPTPAGAASLDWAVPAGHFYSQTASEGTGFVVADPFLKELRSRGGPEALGYPISQPFDWKGTTVQAFQKAVLQWLPGENRVAFLNVFDDLAQAGHNPWLKAARSTPEQTWLPDEAKLDWEGIVAARQSFLDAQPAIKARYFAVKDPMSLYGLPSSRVEDMGNHYALRLQRAVIQLWKVDVPWARAGQTTVANGGDIAKEAGLFPADPLRPGTPDGKVAPPLAPTPAAPTVPTGSPFRDPPIRDIPRAGAAKRVVVDAGHGGTQIGSTGGGIQEKALNLQVALRTAELLRAAGYEVKLTREGDHQAGPTPIREDLQHRIDIANAFRADAFVSIHHNGIGNASTRGTEVYYGSNRAFTNESRALAELIYLQLGRHMAAAGYEPTPRGVKADTSIDGDHLFLLSPQTSRVERPGLMPSALGEGLFLTNLDDLGALLRPGIREASAQAYAVAISTFLAGRKPWFPA